MNLFDETENKYYEFIAYLMNDQETYSKNDINRLIDSYLPGEQDFEVTETLFASGNGNELLFQEEKKDLFPVMDQTFPIRNSLIENQAAKTLLTDNYINHFLSEKTIEKLRAAMQEIVEEWNPAEVTVKNLFAKGASDSKEVFNHQIALITRAIRRQQAITYDNIRPGLVERKGSKAFPVKIEFSVVNDQFRICAYEPHEHRFIKINLDTLQNIELIDEISNLDLQGEYQEYLKINTKKAVLDVDPVEHVIERCFRIFSYFNRKARYDREENKYSLEIAYFKADEKEVIKNILSMGSYVAVIEPRALQKEVYRRVLAASKLYEE